MGDGPGCGLSPSRATSSSERQVQASSNARPPSTSSEGLFSVFHLTLISPGSFARMPLIYGVGGATAALTVVGLCTFILYPFLPAIGR